MKNRFLLPSFAALALAGCTTVDELPSDRVGETTLLFANGLPAGTVQLLSNGQTVTVAVAAAAMSPGEHGFHLHTTGQCTAPDFTSAGGHLNPGNKTHGSLSPGGQHLGDMPNLIVGANRTGSTEVQLEGNARDVIEDIFDADGTAVVVHAGPDDYRTDPAGDAGSRIACGVLKRV
ncbi:superoxide dismutase family protein [Qipengyuania qiaonensis]|uniref:Superoxide dismutase family protein n=1 Tax=Qipengyuania qiaonensis TaxID=2867240 RepID=A0ABS7J9Q2_9SPHN|nr:superoxide dismutase family protein [Qipengyuania qiaonensis]MBX7482398.1 superoxide dismutase family protein [Qipengyuania qiaonensis]